MKAILTIVVAGLVIAFAIALRILFSMLFAFPLYWAWNESMVLFGLPSLDWGSAFCLLVVAAFLLPSPSSSSKKD